MSSTMLCTPYNTFYTPRKQSLSTLYQVSQNYHTLYNIPTHEVQHCASAPPHQHLHHPHLHHHDDYTRDLEY
jgi:hypothetical protein